MKTTASTDERERTERAIRAAKLPRYVVDRRYQMDIDSAGEEVVLIWLILTDDKRLTAREIYRNKDAIGEALQRAGVASWPHVYFRTVSEQRSFDRSKRRA
jgi:hypothetical protein